MALLASLTASLSLVVPDATINMVKISSIKGGSGQLPLAMCRWPLWIASADHVTKLSGAGGDEEEAGWVDPISFEQLWLPEDLPLPSSHLAVSLVIKDGVPRYLLPCIETSITTVSGVSGTVWHNRGLNSVPLGAQWMAWGEAPLKVHRYVGLQPGYAGLQEYAGLQSGCVALQPGYIGYRAPFVCSQAYRLFSFGSDFKPPAPPPARRHPRGARAAAEEGAAEEAATAEEELPPAWEPLQVMADRPGGGGQPVEEALGSIMRVLAEAGAAAESKRTEMPSLAAAHAAAYRSNSLITGPGRLFGSREERPRRVNAEERLPWRSGACLGSPIPPSLSA